MVYMRDLDEYTNNLVLPLLYSIIIDIFSLPASRFYRIWGVAVGSR